MIKKIQIKIKNQIIKYLKKLLIFFFNKDDEKLYKKNINIYLYKKFRIYKL